MALQAVQGPWLSCIARIVIKLCLPSCPVQLPAMYMYECLQDAPEVLCVLVFNIAEELKHNCSKALLSRGGGRPLGTCPCCSAYRA